MEWVRADPTVPSNLLAANNALKKKRLFAIFGDFEVCRRGSEKVSWDRREYGDNVGLRGCLGKQVLKCWEVRLNMGLHCVHVNPIA